MNCQNLWLEASRLALVNSAKGTMQKIREFLKVPELLASVAEGLQASFRQFYMCLTCLISQMECYEVYLKYVISSVIFKRVLHILDFRSIILRREFNISDFRCVILLGVVRHI